MPLYTAQGQGMACPCQSLALSSSLCPRIFTYRLARYGRGSKESSNLELGLGASATWRGRIVEQKADVALQPGLELVLRPWASYPGLVELVI